MSLEDLTPQTRARIERASAWQSTGHLALVPKWMPLDIARRTAPTLTGLYALGFPRGLRYDKGQTRIVYIGSTKNLRKRLSTHARTPQNDVVRQLQCAFPEELLASWWPIPGLSRKWLLGFEGQSLWAFEHMFGTVPIGNLDIPESPVLEHCADLVLFTPCTCLDDAPTLEEYAKLIGRTLVREKKVPNGDPSEVSLLVRVSDTGRLIWGSDKYTAARFYSPEEVEQKRTMEVRLLAEDDALEDIDSITHETNVAVWSVGKMKQLIGICGGLMADERRNKSTVERFLSTVRSVPKPHTWGEVALVQGRLLAGTWFPPSRVWVKVLHCKELLGQAFLSARSEHGSSRFRGEDISDLPQRKGRRPCLWNDDGLDENQSPAMNALFKDMNASFARRGELIADLEERVYGGIADERELDRMLKKQKSEQERWFERLDKLQEAENRKRLATTARMVESLFQTACKEHARA